MFCTKCGTRNDDNATSCSSCGNALRPATYAPTATQPPAAPQAPIAQSYVPPASPAVPVAGVPATSVPNYLVQAILVTLCCCLPFGIVSIVFASQVNTKLALGDVNGALESSRQARLFAWIGFGIGAGGALIYAVLMMLGVVASIAGHAH